MDNYQTFWRNQRSRRGGRRQQPRIPALGAFCTEISDEKERYTMVADLSTTGLRLHRPYRGATHRQILQLELDLPGIDEIIWATGVVCFDSVWQASEGHVYLQTTGLELASAASRHLRLLRDYTLDHAARRGCYADRRAG
jgi:hypothetical protein